jgi:ABC-type transporter Mla maintaining outer membrane lipid asymmetry ATPase subunit MlaF
MEAIVAVEGIARAFGDALALRGIDLDVPEGSVAAPVAIYAYRRP